MGRGKGTVPHLKGLSVQGGRDMGLSQEKLKKVQGEESLLIGEGGVVRGGVVCRDLPRGLSLDL